MSLVSARDVAHLRARHLDDSLALQEHLDGVRTLLDVGSGGGFPGIPLAIANPQIEVTLVERNQKKSSFLQHVVMAMELANANVINSDIRDARDALIAFDVITARAVANPQQIWAWCRDLLSENGRILLQMASPIEDVLTDGIGESHRSSGIGWINVVRRAVS